MEKDGRIYWCAEHLDDPDGARILDVTDAGYHTRPLTKLSLGNRLTSYADDGHGKVRLAGSVVNPLGRVKPGAELHGSLEFRARRTSLQSFHFPLTSLTHAGRTLDWTAQADIARKLRPLGIIDVVWDVWLNLDIDGDTVDRPGLGRPHRVNSASAARPAPADPPGLRPPRARDLQEGQPVLRPDRPGRGHRARPGV